ncbi:MAG: hypothetical protein JO328_16315 [Hyphomicrobiales bacterium]|nr:hypothetical protein [Hyphomicrobiales bacterium]MBV8823446.1 hypothetical protein [Hyphomicrobiales bacterium]
MNNFRKPLERSLKVVDRKTRDRDELRAILLMLDTLGIVSEPIPWLGQLRVLLGRRRKILSVRRSKFDESTRLYSSLIPSEKDDGFRAAPMNHRNPLPRGRRSRILMVLARRPRARAASTAQYRLARVEAMTTVVNWTAMTKDVAVCLCGLPDPELSTPNNLRFGANGSLSVKVNCAGFYDRENNVGGSLVDLVKLKLGADDAEAIAWLERKGFVDGQERPKPRIVKAYDYRDERGVLLYQVCRLEPKAFLERRPDARGGFVSNIKNVRRVLYRLPELVQAIAEDRTIFVVEGEKDCDTLSSLGLAATCNLGGANKWRAKDSAALRGARVVLLPDNDEAGREHVGSVGRALQGIAATVRVLDRLPMPERGDITDWIAAGGTADALAKLAEHARVWTPSSAARVRRKVSRLKCTTFNPTGSVAAKNHLSKELGTRDGFVLVWGPPKRARGFVTFDVVVHAA